MCIRDRCNGVDLYSVHINPQTLIFCIWRTVTEGPSVIFTYQLIITLYSLFCSWILGFGRNLMDYSLPCFSLISQLPVNSNLSILDCFLYNIQGQSIMEYEPSEWAENLTEVKNINQFTLNCFYGKVSGLQIANLDSILKTKMTTSIRCGNL